MNSKKVREDYKDSDWLIDKGLTKFNHGNFKKANEIFARALKKNPSNARAWQYSAMTLYELGMYEEASIQIKKAHEINPHSIEICSEFIKIHLKIGTYGQLLQFCQENQKLDPEMFKYNFVEIHARFRQYIPALEHLNDLLTVRHDDPYLLRLKDYLMQAERNCSNYYIPIIQTGLLPHIPLGDEIIYSSNMRIHWEIIIPYNERKGASVDAFLADLSGFLDFILDIVEISVGDKIIRGEIFSDVLMTHEGIVFMKPKPEKESKIKVPQFIPWRNIKVEKNSTLVVVNFDFNYLPNYESEINFDFNYLPNYESESSFVVRTQKFYEYIMAKRYKYTQKCLEKIKKYVKDFKDADAQEWFNRGRNSNIWHSDYNLGKQLADAFDPAKIRMRQTDKEVSDKAENIILMYLNEKEGKAFTSRSLRKRIGENVEDSKIVNYVNENLEGILNRLVYSGKIQLATHNFGKFYYTIHCPFCHKQITSREKICSYCHTSLEEENQ
ncbi:MAG: tetratricopeptide repeat protein [Promethearchaeota archaeon]